MNNLPAEIKENGFFKKVFSFIKSIFKRKNTEEIQKQKIEEQIDNHNTWADSYKVENIEEKNKVLAKKLDKEQRINKIIKIIEENPDELKKLDLGKLMIIRNYYKNKLKEYKKHFGEES